MEAIRVPTKTCIYNIFVLVVLQNLNLIPVLSFAPIKTYDF